MQKSFLRTRISITVIFLFIGASVIPTAPTTINNSPTDSCDIPTWQMGDEWIYTADPVSYNSDSGSFIGRIENFKREVIGVTTITHDDEKIEVYQLDLTGDITGEISWEGLSGDLEGEVEGVSYIRVSDLAEVKTEIVSTGIVQILFINRDYELIHTNKFFPPFELYDFPLKLFDQWEISLNVINSGLFIIDGLVNEQYSESDMLDETLQCTKEIVSVPAGDFESYKITYPSDTYWYSPEVGNLVKSEVEQGYRDYTFNMDLSLESFSRGSLFSHLTHLFIHSLHILTPTIASFVMASAPTSLPNFSVTELPPMMTFTLSLIPAFLSSSITTPISPIVVVKRADTARISALTSLTLLMNASGGTSMPRS